jgi:hypothetical protein
MIDVVHLALVPDLCCPVVGLVIGYTIWRTFKGYKGAFAGRHEFERVSPSDIPDLDPILYDDAQAALERLGFSVLADIEDKTLSKIYPDMRTFIRVMVGGNGTIIAGLYQLKIRPWPFGWLKKLLAQPPEPCFIVDLETEFNNDTYLVTNNSLGLDNTGEPEAIYKVQLPVESTLEELLNQHAAAIAQWHEEVPDMKPLSHPTFEAVIEAQHRMQELRNAYQNAPTS